MILTGMQNVQTATKHHHKGLIYKNITQKRTPTERNIIPRLSKKYVLLKNSSITAIPNTTWIIRDIHETLQTNSCCAPHATIMFT